MAESADDPLQNDIKCKEFTHGIEQGFWALLECTQDTVYVQFNARDGQPYVMRLDCDRYGHQAIGGRFVDPSTRQCITSAWPAGTSVFGGWVKWDPQHLFICWPGDRYGLRHHPDWTSLQVWRRPPNPMVIYANFIRRLLWDRSMGYTGKAA